MGEIKYEYKFQDISFQETSSYLNMRYSRRAFVPIVVAFIVAVISFLFLIYLNILNVGFGNPAHLVVFLVLLGFLIAFFIVTSIQSRRYIHAIEHAPWRQGTAKITLSENGIHAVQASGEQSIRWDFVTEVVVDLPDKVLLLMSPADYIPCPVSSLPSGLTRAALLDQIAEWRKAAA